MNSKDIEKINDKKEQLEVVDEIEKVCTYKNKLQSTNYAYDSEIQSFISDTINKYRYKPEVANFYNVPNGQDIIPNQYDTLCGIEKMITQYASMKGINEIYNYLWKNREKR